MRRSIRPRIGDFFFVAVFAGSLLIGQRMLNVDSDLGRHLVLGRYMIRSGHVPARDILSFTKFGDPRPPYEWLSQVAFAAADLLLGLDGVVLLSAAVLAGAYLIAFLDARARRATPLAALVLSVWATAASSLNWLTRPHLFSFLFLAMWLYLLEQLRLGRRNATWALPLLMLIWANFHGGFIFGILAWAAYCLGYLWQSWQGAASRDSGARLMLSGAGSLVASLATPALGGNWVAVLSNRSPYVLSRTAETMPLNLGASGSWPFAAMVLFGLVLAYLGRKSLVAAHVFLLLTLGAAGLAIGRNIPFFAIAAVPIMAAWLMPTLRRGAIIGRLELRLSKIDARGNTIAVPLSAVAMATLALGAHLGTSGGGLFSYEQGVFPVAASNWIMAHPMGGRVYNDLNWGGYLLYRTWPANRVFIDSQSDFYGELFIRDYSDTLAGLGDWEAHLNSFQITWVLIPPNSPLADRLLQDPNWRVAYQDSTAVILVRSPA